MKIELKNVKIHQSLSEETTAFSATLYINKVKAATVSNRGNGGSNEFHFSDMKLRKEFDEFCQNQPPLPPTTDYPYPLEMDADLYVSCLLEKYEQDKQVKKWCKKETVFRLKGDKEGSWRTYNLPFTEKVKTQIVKQYGDQLELIANETIKL